MAILAKQDTRVALAANCLVGRSAPCTLRTDEPCASAEHARLSFRDGGWHVRDLGSRNGTFVNAQRLEPGENRGLAAGDRLSFGDLSIEWTLADVSPPVAMARRLSSDRYVAASGGGMLALPSADEPLACVLEDEGGGWTIEIDGQSREAVDGEVLTIGAEAFMLHLPVPMPSTVEGQERRTTIDAVELRFRVSRNEEAVEVTVVDTRGPHVLPPRSHHYTLLTLARVRARDREDSKLAESQRGWVFVDELCRMLSVDEYRLNTEIYRIRQDVASIGLSNAAALVERRRGSRQLRVATGQVKIAGMA